MPAPKKSRDIKGLLVTTFIVFLCAFILLMGLDIPAIAAVFLSFIPAIAFSGASFLKRDG